MSKKLFAVKLMGTKTTATTPSFNTKDEAKKYRKSINEYDADDNEIMKSIVTRGVDHRHFGQ